MIVFNKTQFKARGPLEGKYMQRNSRFMHEVIASLLFCTKDLLFTR